MKKYLIAIGTAVLLLVVGLIVYQSMLIPILSTFLGFLLILGVLQKFEEIYSNYFSVQVWIIIVGTLILMGISWFRDSIFPNFDNLPIETSRLFLPLLVNAIVGFGVAFSIWGSIYVYYLKKGHGDKRKRLGHQGFFLFAFLSYCVFVLFFLFIQPLYLQIST